MLRLSEVGPVRPFSEFCYVLRDFNLSFLKCLMELFNIVYKVENYKRWKIMWNYAYLFTYEYVRRVVEAVES